MRVLTTGKETNHQGLLLLSFLLLPLSLLFNSENLLFTRSPAAAAQGNDVSPSPSPSLQPQSNASSSNESTSNSNNPLLLALKEQIQEGNLVDLHTHLLGMGNAKFWIETVMMKVPLSLFLFF